MRDDAGLDAQDPRRAGRRIRACASHVCSTCQPLLAEVDYFFNIYKDLEGKKSDTYGWEDRLGPHQVILGLHQAYADLKAG